MAGTLRYLDKVVISYRRVKRNCEKWG
uniref:Uncharacterized protein n=1 Tax=Anguilla anguilla TaxID=7936 RepID=A0A0E9SN80_ANGAN